MPKWNHLTEHYLSRATHRLKRRRVRLFIDSLGLGPEHNTLDLGSEDGSYLAAHYPWRRKITLADVRKEPLRRGVKRYGLAGFVVIPPEGPLPFDDRAYDAVWCNSVIEHVTAPRRQLGRLSSREFTQRAAQRQQSFAREVRRVAKSYFVQTPHRAFPIEAHSWLPGVQTLPHAARYQLSRRTKRLWVKQWTADWHLYDLARFRADFPDATAIHIERVLGLPKSLIAIRRHAPARSSPPRQRAQTHPNATEVRA